MTCQAFKESDDTAANGEAEVMLTSDVGHGFIPNSSSEWILSLNTKNAALLYTAGLMTVTCVHFGTDFEQPVLDELGAPLVIDLSVAGEPRSRPIGPAGLRKVFVRGAGMLGGSGDDWKASMVAVGES